MNRIRYLAMLVIATGLSACSNASHTPYQRPDIADPGPPPDTSSPYTYQPCDSTTGGSTAAADTDAAADGIWQGTLTNELLKATEPYTAVVAGDGRFRLLSASNWYGQMTGTLAIDGNGYTGEGFADAGGKTWHDGTEFSELTISGTIAERDSMNGDFSLASGDGGCFRFAYDAGLYERPSSPDLVAGTWLVNDGWGFDSTILEVSTQGTITGVDWYACNYSGSLTLLDTRFNLYAVTLEITQRPEETYPCWGPGSYDGFAYLVDTGDGASANHYLHLAIADGENGLRFFLHR